MTLAELKDEVDHIGETWRGGTPDEQRSELVRLDEALAELDDMDVDTPSAAQAVEELRGRIEILMDEIEISLGVALQPIEEIEELEIVELEIVELVPGEEDALIRLDDPRATALVSAVEKHLAADGSAETLRDDFEAIDDLDDGASSALKAKLDDLRAQIEKQLSEEEEVAPEPPRLTPLRDHRPGPENQRN